MASSTGGKDLQRKLKIKTGTVKRLGKELESYEKEATKQQEKITKMKNDQANEYDVRKQEEVLQETQQMLPDTLKRLKQAKSDLDEHMDIVSKHGEAEAIKGTEDWKLAAEVIAYAAQLIGNH